MSQFTQTLNLVGLTMICKWFKLIIIYSCVRLTQSPRAQLVGLGVYTGKNESISGLGAVKVCACNEREREQVMQGKASN